MKNVIEFLFSVSLSELNRITFIKWHVPSKYSRISKFQRGWEDFFQLLSQYGLSLIFTHIMPFAYMQYAFWLFSRNGSNFDEYYAYEKFVLLWGWKLHAFLRPFDNAAASLDESIDSVTRFPPYAQFLFHVKTASLRQWHGWFGWILHSYSLRIYINIV